MSRPLRLLVAGGWYHVVNRGIRREWIFRTDEDRRRFLGRLAELPERFHVEMRAFVLMDNHYQAAAQAVRRFAEGLRDDPARQKFVTDLRRCAHEH